MDSAELIETCRGVLPNTARIQHEYSTNTARIQREYSSNSRLDRLHSQATHLRVAHMRCANMQGCPKLAIGETFYRPARLMTPNRPTRIMMDTRRRLKVTNEGREVKVDELYDEAGLNDDSHILVDPSNPVPHPELGPLERRVSITFEEGLALETIDREAMQYWFTEPAQGWQTEKRKLRKARGVPVDDSFDDFRHTVSAHPVRKALDGLNKGDILPGKVVEQLLHHGLRVDVGCEADALVPMRGIELWKIASAKGVLPGVGDHVEVRVVAVHKDRLFRFPLVVAPMDDGLDAIIPSAEDHKPSLDLRDVSITRYEEVAKMSGREYGTQNVLVMPDDMDVELPSKEELVFSEEEVQLFDSIVSDL